jgi:outer membrane protein TolC
MKSMRMGRLCGGGLLLLILAQPSPGFTQDLTVDSALEDYLRVAAENHPGLRASFERWSASTSTVAREKGWPDPVLSYSYFIEPVQTAVGPQQHRIGVVQAIPWFGRLSAQGSAAEQRALAAEQDYRAAPSRTTARRDSGSSSGSRTPITSTATWPKRSG